MDLAMYIVDFAHHLHMLVRNYLKIEENLIAWHMELSAGWVQVADGVWKLKPWPCLQQKN